MVSKKKGTSPKAKKSKRKEEPAVSKDKNDVEDDSTSAGTITTAESTKSTRSREKKSIICMYKVVVKKAMGKKFKVTYNSSGNPNGPERHTLQSYIGLLARTMVPININSWPEVDADLKDRIWEDIQNSFKVAPESKKLVLTSAGTKWRQFKTTLINKYVLPYLGRKKKLRKPPKQYSFVGLQPWKDFVSERSTKDWLRKKNPKGGPIDHAMTWKKARERKSGEIDEELTPVLREIDELLDKKQKGEFKVSGSNDILTRVLKTAEHSGRVRGVGGFVNPSTYFNLPKQKRVRITKADLLARDQERELELEETKKMLKEQQEKMEAQLLEKIAQLEALVMGQQGQNAPAKSVPATDEQENPVSPISDKASLYTSKQSTKEYLNNNGGDGKMEENVGDCEIVTHPQNNILGVACELAVGSITNIVAFGTLLEDEFVNTTIHGVPLEEGSVRVSVDGDIQSKALLPFPVKDEMETVGQAVGSHVAWPKEFVIWRGMSKKKKKNVVPPKTLFQEGELHPFVPKRCKLLYKHAKTIMTNTGLSMYAKLDKSVFGFPRELYLLTENVIDLLEMKWIGVGVIVAYMVHLHEILTERELLDTFAFVDPSATYQRQESDVEKYLLERLREGKADRIFFVPRNPGKHWILTIIWENEIFTLDSMAKPIHYIPWENSLKNAVRTFNAETGRGKKQPALKSLPGAPKQPGGHECGYYVMRYMKDIIDDVSLGFPTKWVAKTRKSYTQELLDEVRIDVAEYMQNLL